LTLADNPHSTRVTEEITRIISIPSMTVLPVWQVPRATGGQPGIPGGGVPGNPGVLPNPRGLTMPR
jgi:hypothetical protein